MGLSNFSVSEEMKGSMNTVYGAYLREVELWKLNDKPVNENEDAGWEIIKGAYCEVLQDDSNWHFFYEGKYNIIRCSEEFYEQLLEYLEECGVYYVEKGVWLDGSNTVRLYQQYFMPLFHNFSMLALQEYGHWNISSLLDRVIHCFMNHQHFVLNAYRKIYKDKTTQNLLEAKLIGENAVYRAHYIGRCDGILEYEENHKNHFAKAKKVNEDNLGKTGRFINKVLDFFHIKFSIYKKK